MIDGSEKRNRQLAFELQNSHLCEKRSKAAADLVIDQISTIPATKNLRFPKLA